MERDLVGQRVVVGLVPRRGLQQRVGEEGAEAVEVVARERAVDEGEVADRDRSGEGQSDGFGGGRDGVRSRVGSDGADGQSGTGWHWPQGTGPAAASR